MSKDSVETGVDSVIEEYEGKLDIDKNDLDTQLEIQSNLLFTVSDELNKIINLKDKWLLNFNSEKAGIFGKMRKEIEDLEGKKPSDTRLDKEIWLEPRYQVLQKELVAFDNCYNRLTALKKAIEQKSHSLKGLGDLYIAKYFEVTEIKETSNMSGRRRSLRK